MFPSRFRRQVVYVLLAALIFPVLGPISARAVAAEHSVSLDADSNSGEALIVTGLIIGAIVLVARGISQKHKAEHYQRGLEFMAQGDFDRAVEEFEEAGKYKDAPVRLEKAKKAACVYHYELVKEALAQKNYLTAYRHLKKILALNPDYEDVPDLYAQVKAWLKPFLTVRVAVLDFDNRSGYYNLGRQASSFLINEIVNQDLEFVEVVERVELEKILREQRLWGSGYFDPESIQEVGKLLGVNYLVLGEILNADVDTQTTYTVVTDEGKVRVRYRMEREATVSAAFRVVDAETGTVVVSDSITEEARDVDYSYWRWGFGSLDSESELTQEALERIIDRFGTKLQRYLEKEVSESLEGGFEAVV